MTALLVFVWVVGLFQWIAGARFLRRAHELHRLLIESHKLADERWDQASELMRRQP